jgi:hypothetical protein
VSSFAAASAPLLLRYSFESIGLPAGLGPSKGLETFLTGGRFFHRGSPVAFGAKRKELTDARDAKLKVIFTEAQMKQWKDEIEPSMRPQRGGGGGGGGK